MDHNLQCEVDVELAALDDPAACLVSWFNDTLDGLASAERHGIENGPKLPADAIRRPVPCGPPHAIWGFVSVTHDGGKAKSRIYTARNMAWFLNELQRTPAPTAATLQLSHLDAFGYPDDRILRIEFACPEYSPEWARFYILPTQSQLAARTYQDKLLDVVRDFAHKINPSFGQLSYGDGGLARTEFELASDMPLLPRQLLPDSRRYLRGYHWLTVCPQELADKLGGPHALQATGAFTNVTPLRNGGVWLQATDTFADYDMAAATRTWNALAPVLRPGPPRTPDPYDTTPVRLVLEDDATRGAA